MSEDERPLVSIGVPVRNGADTLSLALESILGQTYSNLEILVSDNNSSDATPEICQSVSGLDSRVRYFRQAQTLTALDNFRFLFEASSGQYFMWAAADDLRKLNYVETLLGGFMGWPTASLVFSDVAVFSDYAASQQSPVVPHSIDTRGQSFWRKHIVESLRMCYHFYGLIHTKYLRSYPWFEIEFAPDQPLLRWLLCFGDFVYVPGTTFYYYAPEKPKSAEDMAVATASTALKPFHRERIAWTLAESVALAEHANGRRCNPIVLCLLFYAFTCIHSQGGLIPWLAMSAYGTAPPFVRRMWRFGKRLSQTRPRPV